ncbi:ABC transporter permease [Paenibacillus sp. CN-4]|uniref:ABC transporter permease n=1 Tax=Paenibacillus nanchangensis TaxID=3348343 RepID=UPI0039783FB1
MLQSISAEWLKLRRSRILLLLAVLPVVSLVIGGSNYYFNRQALQDGWYSLWTQASLFYGEFFLPILIAICCSYVCRLEHVNRNWNMVMTTPVSASSVYFAKWCMVSLLILFAQTLFMVMYWLTGLQFSIPGPLPGETIEWAVRGWIASLSIIALQLGLSIRMRSFATPIGICLCAVFVGLGLYVTNLGMFFPFSLLTIGMGVLSQTGLTGMQNVLFFVLNLLFILVFSGMTIRRLKHKDIAF